MDDDFEHEDVDVDVDDPDFDFDQMFGWITTGYPVTAQCAYHTRGCDHGPDWVVTYHDCNTELVCSLHSYQYIGKVMEILAAHGSVVCESCGMTFRYLTDFLTWRPV